MKLIDSIKLRNLFNDNPRRGQELLPELVKRIITTNLKMGLQHAPSGNAVFVRGYDITLTNAKSLSKFIPNGNSFWELGTSSDAFQKLKDDFDKRSAAVTAYDKKEYEFIFCTPFIIANDNATINWLEEKKKLNIWKDIKIVDGIVLEDWLESNIGIAIWLLREFGEQVPNTGIHLLEDEYRRINTLTTNNISREMMVCSNDKHIAPLLSNLHEYKHNYMVIKSPINFDYGYFFVVGAISKDDEVADRTIIVKNQDALNAVKQNCRGKVVVLGFNCADDDLGIDNTYIYITTNSAVNSAISLEQPRFNDFKSCLENMGFNTQDAYHLTSTLNRNISCFIRKYATSPTVQSPSWAAFNNKNEIIPIALVSKFNVAYAGDREVVAKLSGKDIEEYIEVLDKWLDVEDAIISKEDKIYVINSKEEALKSLSLNIKSSKVKTLEGILYEIFLVPDPIYKKDVSQRQIRDKQTKYSKPLIEGILASFAILSNDDADFVCQSLVKKILDAATTNEPTLLTAMEFLPELSEVSATETLNFIENLIDADDALFRKAMEQSYGMLFSSSHAKYISWTLERCVRREDACVQALRILLKIYYGDYNIPSSVNIVRDVETFFAPCTSGVIATTAKAKFDLFRTFSKGKDITRAIPIIQKMRLNQLSGYFVPSAPRWKAIDEEKFCVTYEELYEINALANQWLVDNISDKIELIKDLIENISSNTPEINQANLELIDKLTLELDERQKTELNHFVLAELSEIKFYVNGEADDWQYKAQYIESLEKLYNNTMPTELFDRYSYIFKYEFYELPLIEPATYDTDDSHKINDDTRNELLKESMLKLLKYYGNSLAEKIINMCIDSYECGRLLYQCSIDKISIVRMLIESNKRNVIQGFLAQSLPNEITNLFQQLTKDEKQYTLPLFPCQEELIDLLNATEYEAVFWTNRSEYPPKDNSNSFSEKVFNKLLAFNPHVLIDWCLYHKKDVPFEQVLRILECSAKDLSKARTYSIAKLISRLDKQYYSDELARIEFMYLPVFLNERDGFPLGIKKFFWHNPLLLADLIGNSTQSINNAKTVGQAIVMKIISPFGHMCWIPENYMIEQPENLKRWVEVLLSLKDSYCEKSCKLIVGLILNTLAFCPQVDDIRFPNHVAELIERIAGDKLEEQRKVASTISRTFINSIGCRTVGDGSSEYKRYKEYLAYANLHKALHPATSLALEYISNFYKRTANEDRQSAITGWYDV